MKVKETLKDKGDRYEVKEISLYALRSLIQSSLQYKSKKKQKRR